MVYENNLKPIENKKPTETVYEIPSYEEFTKNYNENEKISDNYQNEFDSCGDIRVIKSYGPGNTSSVEGERRAKNITKWVVGGVAAGVFIAFPPAAPAVFTSVGVMSGGAKIAGKFVDEDSKLREAFDTTSEVYAGGLKKEAKIYTGYKYLESQK